MLRFDPPSGQGSTGAICIAQAMCRDSCAREASARDGVGEEKEDETLGLTRWLLGAKMLTSSSSSSQIDELTNYFVNI